MHGCTQNNLRGIGCNTQKDTVCVHFLNLHCMIFKYWYNYLWKKNSKALVRPKFCPQLVVIYLHVTIPYSHWDKIKSVEILYTTLFLEGHTVKCHVHFNSLHDPMSQSTVASWILHIESKFSHFFVELDFDWSRKLGNIITFIRKTNFQEKTLKSILLLSDLIWNHNLNVLSHIETCINWIGSWP